jgi:hypothetical protein
VGRPPTLLTTAADRPPTSRASPQPPRPDEGLLHFALADDDGSRDAEARAAGLSLAFPGAVGVRVVAGVRECDGVTECLRGG